MSGFLKLVGLVVVALLAVAAYRLLWTTVEPKLEHRIGQIGLTSNEIAANGPLGVKATKELVRLAVTSVEQAHARQTEWFPTVFQSEDAVEGATAFVEKRDPVWKGR